MRISAKGRYALAAMMDMAQRSRQGDCITVVSIADRLGISKIYLEQVFSLLKKGGLVHSVKGSQGGYQLTRMPQRITVYDVLFPVETTLFEKAESTVPEKAPAFDAVMRLSAFNRIDDAVKSSLSKVTLSELVQEADQYGGDGYMYYI